MRHGLIARTASVCSSIRALLDVMSEQLPGLLFEIRMAETWSKQVTVLRLRQVSVCCL